MREANTDLERQERGDRLALALLFILAGAIRFATLSHHPLWLDEIYGYQLGVMGWETMLRNSLFDPHPPLYYAIQWVASGFDHFHTAWSWRWLPALCGAASVPLLYRVARFDVGRGAAALAAGLLALSPTHLYFSQEARSPAWVLLLTLLSIYLCRRVMARPQWRAGWALYGATLLLGFLSSYNFLLVAGIQCLAFFLLFRQRRGVVVTAALSPGFALAAAPMVRTVYSEATRREAPFSGVTDILQSLLAGDPVRYGFFWGHRWLLVTLLLLAGLGALHGILQRRERFALYYLWQASTPLLLLAALIYLLNYNYILSQAKQFLVILPALYLLAALGMEWVFRQRRRALTGLLLASLLLSFYASGVGLQRYFSISKSPEGQAVLTLLDRMRAGDRVVSFHYRPTAALSFYGAAVRPYVYWGTEEGGAPFFRSSRVIARRIDPDPAFAPTGTLGELLESERLWLLTLSGSEQPLAAALLDACSLASVEQYDDFELALLEACSGRAAGSDY